MDKIWGFIPSALIFFALGFIGFIGSMMLLLSGGREWLPLFVAILIFLFVIFVLSQRTLSRKRWKQTAIGFLLAATLLSVWPLYELYLDSIPTVSAEVDAFKYMPFQEDSMLRVLEETPTMKFGGELPRLDGATALYPVYAAAAQMLYPKRWYDPFDSEVMVNTTPDAYSNLFDGTVDAIFAAAPSESQLKTAKAKDLELTLTPIGKEAFVFFVHADNPVKVLTTAELQGIYSGEQTNWSAFGGENQAIRAFQRPEDSGSQTALMNFMGAVPVMRAPVENVEEGMGGIIERVAEYKNHSNAIGFTFRFYGEEMIGNKAINYIAIDGVSPSIETIRDNSYPLSSDFYIITTQYSSEESLKLVEWFSSPQGQRLIEKSGYVPVRNGDDE